MGIMKTRSKTLCRKRLSKSYRILFPTEVKTPVFKEQPSLIKPDESVTVDKKTENDIELGTILSDIFLGHRKICLSDINRDDSKIYLKLEISHMIPKKEANTIPNPIANQTSNNHKFSSDRPDAFIEKSIETKNVQKDRSFGKYKIDSNFPMKHNHKLMSNEMDYEDDKIFKLKTTKKIKQKKKIRKSISVKRIRITRTNKGKKVKGMKKKILKHITNSKPVKKIPKLKLRLRSSDIIRPSKFLLSNVGKEPVYESITEEVNNNCPPVMKFIHGQQSIKEKSNRFTRLKPLNNLLSKNWRDQTKY